MVTVYWWEVVALLLLHAVFQPIIKALIFGPPTCS